MCVCVLAQVHVGKRDGTRLPLSGWLRLTLDARLISTLKGAVEQNEALLLDKVDLA